MNALVREPVVRFLLLGLVLLAGRELAVPPVAAWLDPPVIRVTAAELDRLRSQWRRETGRAPDAAELRALVRAHVDEAILVREARRHGLHESDPVVRQRLVRNMRFAEPDTEADDAALLRAAYALGMDGNDPVVRRRLAQIMRHRIESRVRVTEAEARTWHAAHGEELTPAPRYRFRQVFFAADRDEEAAAAALVRLREAPHARVAGDPFLLGERFRGLTPEDIERRFGAAFARLVARTAPGEWAGPVTSPYGRHLVYVEAVERPRPAAYERVRPRVAAALYEQRERVELRAALDRLRGRYRIEVQAAGSGPVDSGRARVERAGEAPS